LRRRRCSPQLLASSGSARTRSPAACRSRTRYHDRLNGSQRTMPAAAGRCPPQRFVATRRRSVLVSAACRQQGPAVVLFSAPRSRATADLFRNVALSAGPACRSAAPPPETSVSENAPPYAGCSS
jgi:hypothetical protein